MLHQLPGAFALTTGHAQLQLPDITNKGGDALRDRQRTAGFVQHIVHRQGEGVVVRQAALLSDFLRRLQQRIPEHHREEEGRIDAHIVMNAGIGILQHLADDSLHRAVAALGKVAGDGREQRLEQAVFPQQHVGLVAIPGLQQLEHFFEQTRRRHIVEQGGQARQRFSRFRADGHIELGGKAHRAQHAHWILAIAGFRIADQADHAVLQILHAADVVANGKVRHAVIEAVDSEVATLGILLDRAEDVVAQQHAVLAPLGGDAIGGMPFVMTTEGGDLNDFRPEHHMRQAETSPNQTAVAEQLAYLIRRGVGGNVKIFWLFAKQQVADAAADQPGFVARLVEAVHDLEGVFTDIFAGNSMLLTRDHRHRRWFDGGFCLALLTA